MQPLLCPAAKSNTYDEELFLVDVTFGATSIAKVSGKDIKVTRTAAGKYTIELPQPYRKLVRLAGAGVNLFTVLKTDTIGTDGKLAIELQVADGTATDPATGSRLLLQVGVSNNILNDRF